MRVLLGVLFFCAARCMCAFCDRVVDSGRGRGGRGRGWDGGVSQFAS